MHAQKTVTKESLLNNKDITWVGEYEVTIPFNLPTNKSLLSQVVLNFEKNYYASTLNKEFNSGHFNETLKKTFDLDSFSILKLKEMDIFYSFSYLLANSVRSKNALAYWDPNLKTQLSPEEKSKILKYRDTIQVIDPDNYEEREEIIWKEKNPNNFILTKAKFLVYFDAANAKFNAICTTIAPVLDYYDAKSNLIKSEPLFWIPVYTPDTTLNYYNQDINYAINSSISFNLKKLNELKKIDSLRSGFDKLLQNIKANPTKFELYRGISSRLGSNFSPTQLNNNEKEIIDMRYDTVWIANPESFEIIGKYVSHTDDSEDVKSMGFEINWYFDSKEQKLYALSLSFAPFKEYFDDNGNLKHIAPWFYQKICKGKIYKPGE